MVKRSHDSVEEDSKCESPSKKHRKHKKHKHKRKEDSPEKLVTTVIQNEDSKPLKLKIKIGEKSQGSSDNQSVTQDIKKEKKKKAMDDVFRTRKSDEDTSDEEKEWLMALEKGTLNDHGMISQNKSEKLMTVRQRALLHGKQSQPLMELPTGYKEEKKLSEEQVKKKQQRASKRKELAAKKHEKDKKQTLERLLRKQDAKTKGLKGKQHRRNGPPGYRYINSQKSISISIPEGIPDLYTAQKALRLPVKVICGVKGCQNLKKYSCSKTGVPLCSLQCYKKNLTIQRKKE